MWLRWPAFCLALVWSTLASAGTILCGTLSVGGAAASCNLTPLTFSVYTSTTTPLALPNTPNLIEEMNSSVAITAQLNTTGLYAGFSQCVADGGQNFYVHPVTVTAASGTIGGQSGTTGISLNNTGESVCFIYDGISNWVAR